MMAGPCRAQQYLIALMAAGPQFANHWYQHDWGATVCLWEYMSFDRLNIVCKPVYLLSCPLPLQGIAERRPFGRFWHTFFPHGGHIVDQDELDTFTSHTLIGDMHTDVTKDRSSRIRL